MTTSSADPLSIIRGQLAHADDGTEDILIGIIDGVPDTDLPVFDGVALTIEPSMMPADPGPPDSHATEIASLILAKDAASPGLAAGCSGLALPIFFGSKDRHRRGRASQLDLARAITLGTEHGTAIINVSAGQRSSTPAAGRHLDDSLARCRDKGVLVVAAAGNDGCACVHVPAALPMVLAVGAMDVNGRPHEISNWGAAYQATGLLAPGAEVRIPGSADDSARRTGTSYATAIVTGVAARLLATARHAGHKLDALDVRAVLLESADPCDPAVDGECARFLAGRLNAAAALDRLMRYRPPELRPAAGEAAETFPTPQESIMAETVSQAIDAPAHQAARVSNQVADAVTQQACACGGAGKEEEKGETEQAAAKPTEPGSVSKAISQQACSCAKSEEPQMAYALGALWFDFGSEARYDAIVQQMNDPVAANNPPLLFEFLSGNLPFAAGLTFILMQDQIPIYAVRPAGPFALDTYKEMLDALKTSLQSEGDMQRVAVPGFISGVTRLMNGMMLPVLYPDLRGMVKWQSAQLIRSAKRAAAAGDVPDDVILNFLNRVYDELRNLGLTPDERAINFAATNAYQIAEAFSNALGRRLELYQIRVVKSPICRPDSDCWDVFLTMFDPENERRAGRVYRYTIDVSEVLPVTLGRMRNWAVPLAAI